MYNPNKTISVNSKGLVISFTDNNKHQFVKFERKNALRDIPTRYQEIEHPVLNDRQQKMYSEALYGLSVYSDEQIKRMPKHVVIKIIARCNSAQIILNRWKQEISNEKVDNFLIKLFPNSPVIKQMLMIKGSDDSIKNDMSFKDVDLTQEKIANKLVECGLLPQNFFNLV